MMHVTARTKCMSACYEIIESSVVFFCVLANVC